MARTEKNGFSLIEMLLVIAMIGILSGIAIPAYMGQRKRARMVGDAQTNAQILAMALETQRADSGVYGAEGSYKWIDGTPSAEAATLLPAFTPKGNSKMNFDVRIGATGLTYFIDVYYTGAKTGALGTDKELILQTDQTGAILKKVD